MTAPDATDIVEQENIPVEEEERTMTMAEMMKEIGKIKKHNEDDFDEIMELKKRVKITNSNLRTHMSTINLLRENLCQMVRGGKLKKNSDMKEKKAESTEGPIKVKIDKFGNRVYSYEDGNVGAVIKKDKGQGTLNKNPSSQIMSKLIDITSSMSSFSHGIESAVMKSMKKLPSLNNFRKKL